MFGVGVGVRAGLPAGLGGTGGFARTLSPPFPIAVVQALGEFSELRKGVGFSNFGNAVLETIRKSAVELIAQRGGAPADLRSEATELSDVLGYPLVVRHSEVLEVMFHSPRSVIRSKVDAEFLLERRVVRHEHQRVVGHPF